MRKFPGWNVARSGGRTTPVIVLAPSFDLASGVVKGKKPVGVQALIAQPSVERFDEGILHRLPRFDVMPRHPVM